jgi:acyl carrier protein
VTDIVNELERFIAEKLLRRPGQRITEDEPLLSSGLVDSFHLMDLALHVEDTYGVTIQDTELNAQTFDSLAQLETLIQSRQK